MIQLAGTTNKSAISANNPLLTDNPSIAVGFKSVDQARDYVVKLSFRDKIHARIYLEALENNAHPSATTTAEKQLLKEAIEMHLAGTQLSPLKLKNGKEAEEYLSQVCDNQARIASLSFLLATNTILKEADEHSLMLLATALNYYKLPDSITDNTEQRGQNNTLRQRISGILHNANIDNMIRGLSRLTLPSSMNNHHLEQLLELHAQSTVDALNILAPEERLKPEHIRGAPWTIEEFKYQSLVFRQNHTRVALEWQATYLIDQINTIYSKFNVTALNEDKINQLNEQTNGGYDRLIKRLDEVQQIKNTLAEMIQSEE